MKNERLNTLILLSLENNMTYYEQYYDNKSDNLGKIDKFLGTYNKHNKK